MTMLERSVDFAQSQPVAPRLKPETWQLKIIEFWHLHVLIWRKADVNVIRVALWTNAYQCAIYVFIRVCTCISPIHREWGTLFVCLYTVLCLGQSWREVWHTTCCCYRGNDSVSFLRKKIPDNWVLWALEGPHSNRENVQGSMASVCAGCPQSKFGHLSRENDLKANFDFSKPISIKVGRSFINYMKILSLLSAWRGAYLKRRLELS